MNPTGASRARRRFELTVALAIVVAAGAAVFLGSARSLAEATAVGPADKLALGVRVATLVLAAGAWSRSRTVAFVACGGFLASLVARGLLVPSVVVSLAAAYFVDRGEASEAGDAGARSHVFDRFAPWAAALVLAASVAVSLARAPAARDAASAAPIDPRQAVASELARHNPYRARAAALAWAKGERAPGEGHLALAEIDWELGFATKADKVLAKVLDHGVEPALVDRARAMQARFRGASPP